MMKRKRGLALVTVLMATSLLAMLSGTLVMLTRSNFISGEQFRRRQVLMNTCYSGLDYARARLAQNLDWGRQPLAASLTTAQLTAAESNGDPTSDGLVEGSLTGGGQFTVRFKNNIRGLTELPSPTWSRSRVNVPLRCALVQVEGRYEGVTRRIETVLTRRSMLSNSIVAGKDLAIRVDTESPVTALEFRSIVPRGNTAKARGDVYLPQTDQLKFVPQGAVQAAGEISIDSTLDFDSQGNLTSSTGTPLSTNPAQLAAASSQMSATLQTNANVGNGRFTPDKLQAPGGTTVSVPPGEYRFTQPDAVRHYDSNGNFVRAYQAGQLPGVKLQDYQFMPQGNVNVDGDLKISGNITTLRYIPPPPNQQFGRLVAGQPQPFHASLGLGYDQNGHPVGANARNRLTVNGNLTVEGDLVGSGQLFVKARGGSGGDVNVEGNSFMSATRTDGLAVAADGDVTFKEVPNGSFASPFAMIEVDFELFGGAMSNLRPNDAQTRRVFNNFTGASSTELQSMGSEMLSRPVTTRAAYRDYFKRMIQTNDPNWPPAGGQTLGGVNLDNLPFDYHPQTGNPELVSCVEGIARYIDDMGPPDSDVSLEEHLRIREFLKSVDQGQFKYEIVSPFMPGVGNRPSPYGDAQLWEHLRSSAVNQIGAYYQDARLKGQTLLSYMMGNNPYQEFTRRDFTFGGILYSNGNIFTKLASSFRMIGSMITEQGTVGFDNVINGTIMFDPNACEDQFDWARLGLGPIFFWAD